MSYGLFPRQLSKLHKDVSLLLIFVCSVVSSVSSVSEQRRSWIIMRLTANKYGLYYGFYRSKL